MGQFLEYVKMALDNFRANKGRSFLTMLGIIIGVIMLRLIFVALPLVGMDQNLQYAIKGGIILFACALDMRKYLVKK